MSTEVRRGVLHPHEYYETMSRTVRWFLLALVLITYPLNGPDALAVHTLLGFAAVYNLLRYDTKLKRYSFFSAPYNSMAIDHVLLCGLVAYTGGLSSPYYLLFLPLVLAAIAAYGITGFTYVLSGQVVVALLMLQVPTMPVPSRPEFQFIIKLIGMVIFTLIAEQTVRSRTEEYLLEGQFTSEAETERHRLRALINSLSSAFLAVDSTGKVYLYNAAALDFINTHRDIKGDNFDELLPLHDAHHRKFRLMESAFENSPVLSRQDLTYQDSDGSLMIVDLTVTPVQTYGHDKTPGYLVMFKDITKEKSLNEQRDEFIAVISHELRTPLAVIEANLSTTLLPGYTHIEDKAEQLLEQSHQNVVFMSQLIANLANISRAERGDIDFKLELISASELAEELARDFRPQAEVKHLKLNLEILPDVGNIVTGPAQLREILQNFLTNAIKYTSSGSVTLTVSRAEGGTEFIVKDTGIGISASDKAKIFNKFYRSEDYRTRQTGGTGLGLYLTRQLAHKLKAEISFTSRLNHGSAFRLFVPVRFDHAASQAIAAAAHQTVED